MSSALAIASVTAVLKSLLDNRLIEQGVAASLGDVAVTALPPDRLTTGADERSQLNLFLYRVTPNTSWRRGRIGLDNGHEPAGGGNGTPPPAQAPPAQPPPLVLDLHYLLSAYGEQDFQAEILLGYAMQLLHETTTLTRERIRGALAAPNGSAGALPPTRAALAAASLADQVEEIVVAAEFASTEEMSRLWSALQARYRPSATYKVSAIFLGLDATPAAAPAEDTSAEAPEKAPAEAPREGRRAAARGARR